MDAAGQIVIRRKLLRRELVPYFEAHDPSVVVMEACGAAHHWVRVLAAFGHDESSTAIHRAFNMFSQLIWPFHRAGCPAQVQRGLDGRKVTT